jgi:hypothetical protein
MALSVFYEHLFWLKSAVIDRTGSEASRKVSTMTSVECQTVATNRGEVRGVVERSAVCFRGIPFAASPIGELRFAPPQPHSGWTGAREAVRPGPSVPRAPPGSNR